MTFFLIACMSRHRGLRQAIQLSQQCCDSGNTHESRQRAWDVRLEYAGVSIYSSVFLP